MSGVSATINIVFLYTELAGYVLTCLEALGTKNNIRLTVVHWPVKSEAPFELPVTAPFLKPHRSGHPVCRLLPEHIPGRPNYD